MTPHLSDVPGKEGVTQLEGGRRLFSVGCSPTRTLWQILLLRAWGAVLKVQNSFVSSKPGLSMRNYLNEMTPQVSVLELLGFGNNIYIWSEVHHHVNMLSPPHAILAHQPYRDAPHRSLSITREREQALVKAETDTPGSTPSDVFPFLLKSNPNPSPQGSKPC